jgi:hypothetical protein
MPAPTPIPGPVAYQVLGSSPHIQRFGVFRRSLVIKDIAIANHTGLTNTPTTWGTGVLPEGAVMQKATDGNWYMYGVTLPTTSPVTVQAFLSGAIPQMAILIDPYDTTINGAGAPIMGQAYFSGNFILSFLQFGTGTAYSETGAGSIAALLRLNDITVEGTSQVQPGATYPGTGYGVSIPREDAPV